MEILGRGAYGPQKWTDFFRGFIIDREAREIIELVASVRPSVCLSVRLSVCLSESSTV